MNDNQPRQAPFSFLTRCLAALPPRFRVHILLLALLVPAVAYWLAASITATPAATTASTSATDADSVASKAPETPSAAVVNAPPAPHWVSYTVAQGDSLSSIFDAQDFGASTLYSLMQSGKSVQPLTRLRVGDTLRFRVAPDGKLLNVDYALGDLRTLVAENGRDGWQAHVREVTPSVKSVVKDGTVAGPLSLSMRDAGIPGSLVGSFVNIFHWKVDFRRDMRKGATFAVIYQKLNHDGETVGLGNIEAASLTNQGKTLRVYRYEDGNGGYNYYTADGQSLQPAFLRTPVKYTRVSSTFSRHRFNPVLHVWRPHYGVDLAAPMGTPIKAAADGVVKYIGAASGYGRLIELKNMGPYSTRYGHMSRFAKGLKKGDHVHKGQVIAYVGEAGYATGPHLHFEIRVNGRPMPPLKVKLPDSSPLPKKLLAGFKQDIAPLVAVLKDPDGVASQQRLAALDEKPLKTASVEPVDAQQEP